MKILIAVPTYETIFPDTYKSIWDMDKCGHEIQFEFVRGYDVATARNNIAQCALDYGADYVLMVDNDVVLPKDALKNLLEDPQDVCTGYYAHRGNDNLYHGRTCACKLLDEDGREAAPGEEGEICFYNPFFRGYIGLPEETEQAKRGGIYHSGDLGRFDDRGQLLLTGRVNDMIKINGNRVEPAEIEVVARDLLGIDHCIVKGFIDENQDFEIEFVDYAYE